MDLRSRGGGEAGRRLPCDCCQAESSVGGVKRGGPDLHLPWPAILVNCSLMNAQSAAAALGNAANLLKVVALGSATIYGVSNSLFNVEGGHRAIVFNRVVGIKETVGTEDGMESRVERISLAQHGPGIRTENGACRREAVSVAQPVIPAAFACRLMQLPDDMTNSWCRSQVYEEGTHIMVPWFERPILYDVRARPSLISSTSGSKDLQMVCGMTSGWMMGCLELPTICAHQNVCRATAQVNIGLRVLTRPDPLRLAGLYRELGTDYAERVLPSIIQVRAAWRAAFRDCSS